MQSDCDVTDEFHEKAQKVVNAHSIMWVRFLRAGEAVGGQDRIKRNMLVQDSTLALLYALRKDHKKYDCPVQGPPVRPVCGAASAYNTRLSHLLSMMLTEVWKEAESVCMNTEEMLVEFKRVNREEIREDIIIGSADVKALYQSLDIPFAIDKACEIFYNSTIQVAGVDTNELGLYLAVNKTEKQLEQLNIPRYCPTRRTKRGRPPTITGCAINECKSKRFAPWKIPEQEADEQTIRKMLTEAMRIALLFIMQNHIYTYDNKTILQSKGGPIGLQLTGILAQLFMIWWDKQLHTKLMNLGIVQRMYKRYVDDVNTVMNATKPGLRYDGTGLVSSRNSIEEDQTLEADERTMRLFKAVADSIHDSMKMEVDCP